MYKNLALFSLGVALCAAPARAAVVYSVDDGTGESGFGGFQSQDVWLNSFTSATGAQSLTTIRIAFGESSGTFPLNGTPITLLLYTDPNNDGNPVDAVLRSSFSGAVQQSNTGTFIDFVLPSAYAVTPGDTFFVGFSAANFSGNNLGPYRDTNSSAGQSWNIRWLNSGSVDLSNLSSGIINNVDSIFGGSGGNFLIRAVGEDAAAVPEPSAFLLAAAGLVGLYFLRRPS